MPITMDRYSLLYESYVRGANLAPVDFADMDEFEAFFGLDVSDSPTPESLRHKLTLLSKQHSGKLFWK